MKESYYIFITRAEYLGLRHVQAFANARLRTKMSLSHSAVSVAVYLDDGPLLRLLQDYGSLQPVRGFRHRIVHCRHNELMNPLRTDQSGGTALEGDSRICNL